MDQNLKKLVNGLSPNERKILPHIKEKDINKICKKSNLDKISVLRALEYLQVKKVIKLSTKKKKIIEIGVNGALYRKKGLPERRLLHLLNEKRIIPLQKAEKESKLTSDEFKASLGALKKKAMIELRNGKIVLSANKEEISKKSPEEAFLELLPMEYDSLTPEKQYALKLVQGRKDIIQIKEAKTIDIEITELGRKLSSIDLKEGNLIEQITPELLKKESLWKGKRFRRYDVSYKVSPIYGGKRHFVNQAADKARKIWTELGFKEMTGDLIMPSFWNFDALFTAQDHPVREMQDTFFLNKKIDLPDKKLVKSIKDTHEKGVLGSKGWEYKWDEEKAKKLVLRTHTTCLSAQTLANLNKKDIPAKFFSVGKCFRNETVDWAHIFEFNQSEGIVVDKNVNFRHLLGYLKQFYKKMGYDKIRMRPAYFPYTEPSVEIEVWIPERKVWIELGGAGIFRPEVVVPLLGENIPVLAWGPGFDRMIMDYYNIKDLREMYKNDLNKLRKMRV